MTAKESGHHVLVLGGGYAGLLAALRVANRGRRHGARVTLVNAADSFVERIRLHQVAAGHRVASRPITRMLRGTGAEFVQGRVLRLDPRRRRVMIERDGGTHQIEYDTLIYALGSTIDTDSVPGVRDHAVTLGGTAQAQALHVCLADAAARGGHLVVCGGGLTGIEAASECAQAYPGLSVSLVTRGQFGDQLSERGRLYLRGAFTRLGIAVRDGLTVERVRADRLEVTGTRPVPFDLCLWAGSFSVSPLAWEAGLQVNERGQILVDPYVRSLAHPSVYAAGDAAAPAGDPGAPIRMACATAMPMGAQAADNVIAALAGREAEPFRFAYGGRCISLGRGDALVQLVHGDDTPREQIITGRRAAWTKELVCRYAVLSLSLERRWGGAYHWLKGQPAVAETQPGPVTDVHALVR